MPATEPDPHLIVFDGCCVFCSGFAQFIVRHDHESVFRFVTAQSDLGRRLYEQYALDPDLMETNIVVIGGRPHVKMQAFAAAMRALGWPWAALAPLGWLPRTLSDWIYDRIALNRYVFGRRACLMPSPELRMRLLD
jgi:predicted DCC family thiol-disulfide oxidoreductase YuxK